ncbi:MAG: PKD domain-containing protein [Bacteroidetes bacterium]|nr:PKD domain-containing protein [Bacteroidota bacterium]
MRYFKIIWPVLLLLVAVSCKKKDYPDPVVENDPQFYFKGTVNGINTDLEAGINNYYMYASYSQDANNVYRFSGNLKPNGCSFCTNGLEIIINDSRVSPAGASTYIDSAFFTGDYPYIKGGAASTISSLVYFTGSFNQPALLSAAWNFGDGGTSSQTSPQHVFKSLGKKQVCLTMNDSSCNSTVCGTFVARPMGDSSLWASVQGFQMGGDSITFSAHISGQPPLSYSWDFGDGVTTAVTTSTSTSLAEIHQYAAAGSYPVKLKVSDAYGDTVYSNYNANTLNTSNCAANYQVSAIIPLSNPFGFSNIEVKWTDASGIVYTSNNANQPLTSYFEILSVENYKNNENGQSTKRLHVRFKCMVYNGATGILIDNAEAYIAIAYK